MNGLTYILRLSCSTHIFVLTTFGLLLFCPLMANSEPTSTKSQVIEKKYVSADGIVNLQNEMDIIDLIKAVSEIKEEPYLIDESVKPKEVSIMVPEVGMKKEDFLKLFEIILSMNELTVIESDGINKVVHAQGIKSENTPVEVSE